MVFRPTENFLAASEGPTFRDAHVKRVIYCKFLLKNAYLSSKWRLFFSVGRMDMIQSAFDRFNLILFDEVIC